MERKGQGALEYLLLIGGAILVAVIVIALIVGLGGTNAGEANKTVRDGLCSKYSDSNVGCNSQTIWVDKDKDGIQDGKVSTPEPAKEIYACAYNAASAKCESSS